MERYCNLFFFLLFLLFLSHTAKCANTISAAAPNHLCIIQKGLSADISSSGIQEKKLYAEYIPILFRNGIAGKSIVLAQHACLNSLSIDDYFIDAEMTNPGRIKHALSYSDFSISPQEFLSSFSFHAPPILG